MESESHGAGSSQVNEDIMRSLAVSSLEHMSLARVAIAICQQDDVKKLIWEHFSLNSNRIGFTKGKGDELISSLLDKKVNELPIHEHFIPQLSLAVKEIRSEYFSFCWSIIHKSEKPLTSDKDFIRNVVDSCCWTCDGKANYRDSAHHILRNEGVKKRNKNLQAVFQLACKCWLEEDVKFIWMRLLKKSKDELSFKRGRDYLYLHYWLCIIREEEKKFLNYIKNRKSSVNLFSFKKFQKVMDDCLDELRSDVNSYMFAWAVFYGCQLGVNYFYDKLDCMEKDCLVKIITTYLDKSSDYYISAKVAFFLLMKLNLEDRTAIFKSHCTLIIKSTINSWQYRKYTLGLIKINEDCLDEKMYYKIFECLLRHVKDDKNAFVLLKMIWQNIPVMKKHAFCNLIVEHRKYQDSFDTVWKNITPDIFNWFLKLDSVRELYSSKLVDVAFEILKHKRYDIVNLVFEKCLGSERSAMREHMFQVKSSQLINSFYVIDKLNKYLEWALELEDIMNENSVLEFKREILGHDILPVLICVAIRDKMWNEISKFFCFFVRSNSTDNVLVKEINSLKLRVLAQLFAEKDKEYFNNQHFIKTWNEETFEKHFLAFLSCGSTSDAQIARIMNEIKFGKCVWSMCSQWLRSNNWKSLNNFFKWCSKYGKVTWKFKNAIMKKFLFDTITSKSAFWRKKENCENLNKLLYWGCRKNAGNRRKVWTSKKDNIRFAVEIAFNRAMDLSSDELNIFLPWFFEEGTTTEDLYSKIVSSFKFDFVNMICNHHCRSWEEDPSAVKFIINWNNQDAESKKSIADVIKHFVGNYAPALEDQKVKKLIMKL